MYKKYFNIIKNILKKDTINHNIGVERIDNKTKFAVNNDEIYNKINKLRVIDDNDEIIYKNQNQNKTTNMINNNTVISLLNFFNYKTIYLFKNIIETYYDINIDKIINDYNITSLTDTYNNILPSNLIKQNSIIIKKLNTNISCNLYIKFIDGILIKCILNEYDNLNIKKRKIINNKLLIYNFILYDSYLVVCLDIDDITSRTIYKNILDENGKISTTKLYINFLLLILFSIYLYKNYYYELKENKLDTIALKNQTTFDSNNIIKTIRKNINTIFLDNSIYLPIIKDIYNTKKNTNSTYYNLEPFIINYTLFSISNNKISNIESFNKIKNTNYISKNIIISYVKSNTDNLNYCKFSIIFIDINNFYIDYYSLKYSIRCLCLNDDDKKNEYYKLCLTITYNINFTNKKTEYISLYFLKEEDYILFLNNISSSSFEKYFNFILEMKKIDDKLNDKLINDKINEFNTFIPFLNIINKLQYIFCLVKYVYIDEYLLNEYESKLIGGKINSKSYQLYIYNNRYFINYNKKKVYLTKHNTYKNNNQLFIRINNKLNLKIKI